MAHVWRHNTLMNTLLSSRNGKQVCEAQVCTALKPYILCGLLLPLLLLLVLTGHYWGGTRLVEGRATGSSRAEVEDDWLDGTLEYELSECEGGSIWRAGPPSSVRDCVVGW